MGYFDAIHSCVFCWRGVLKEKTMSLESQMHCLGSHMN